MNQLGVLTNINRSRSRTRLSLANLANSRLGKKYFKPDFDRVSLAKYLNKRLKVEKNYILNKRIYVKINNSLYK